MDKIMYKEINEEDKVVIRGVVLDTSNKLMSLCMGSVERAIKLLALINGGGIVALLSYLHDMTEKNCWLIFSLLSFFIGLFLLSLLGTLDFQSSFLRFKEFSENVDKFYSGNIDSIAVFSQGQKVSITEKWTKWFGYFSLIFGWFGIILGFVGYLKNSL